MKPTTLYPIRERHNKVHISDFAHPISDEIINGPKLEELFGHILEANNLRDFVRRVITARNNSKPVILMMGAHVLKVGLGPLLIQLMRSGTITHVACNGASAIHDYEIALIGATSEDVATNLEDGKFGNWQETSQINDIITEGATKDLGFGEAIGTAIIENGLPHLDYSLFATAVTLGLPITVHSAIGTEITHQHDNANGAAIGQTSLKDFRTLVQTLHRLEGGCVINFGSAVIMPEVFLKALTVARNQGAIAKTFTTANFDMIRHYRPSVNVVERPTLTGGKGFTFIGHHEIMLPLVTGMILQAQNHVA